ncbi:hypothetical protein ALT761_02004 [Alteromonas sp. 76-1]|uniref:hypothetical protein n=1 Tax=Alteromonas sp. 76-1 TaxID=2358187 RepID=UPI000FD16CB8|nr:hypothetical protein [Alteromonas sp. 76-1]VEL97005.1 hypothetical protein ALT761_02004 [Alteromonas sp. 76-1]
MDRLFDINQTVAPSWTDGTEWVHDTNPANEVENVYRRIYSDSEEGNPDYRLAPGDRFYIGAAKDAIADWTPRTLPWTFDISAGRAGDRLEFHFGLQVGENDIDTTLTEHSPFIQNVTGDFILVGANHQSFTGIKAKDSDPVLKLTQANTGGAVYGALLNNTGLIDTQGYALTDWEFRKLRFNDIEIKSLDIPSGSSNVSTQDFNISGSGDIGIAIRSGHVDMEVIGGKITNQNHGYSNNQTLLHGLEIEEGGEAIVREVKTKGFSGTGYKFKCPVDVKRLTSTRDGAGLEFQEYSTARYCMVSWTRQLAGDSFAYYFPKGGELNNCGCNLDEVGGLGVVVAGEGATVIINGGDYRAHLPLPFLSALGACTFILNNVMLNGVLYNETVELEEGEAWRSEKATVTVDAMEVAANKTLSLPYQHIPEMVDAIAVQGSQTPFKTVITLPTDARIACTPDGTLRYIPGTAWLHLDPGESAVDYFRYSTPELIYMHKFIINGSEEVGPKVVQPNAFSGSGWTNNNGVYTTTGTSNSLTASYAFEEGEIYQVILNLSERSSGSVMPKLGAAIPKYSHAIEGYEVWLIRAPANTTQIEITASGYKGTVQNIYVQKLIRTEAPALPELSATVDGSTANIEWELIPVTRLRDTYTADVHIQNQELDQEVDAGYVNDDETLSYLFENVWCSGKRKGISLYGCESLEVDGFKCTGGFDGQLDTWIVGIQADLYHPYAKVQQLGNITIDLGLDSNYGNYEAEKGNSDPVVINGAYSGYESYLYSAHLYNVDLANGSDANGDLKKRVEINNGRLEGACKTLRTHKHGSLVAANCEVIQGYGTREVFSVQHSPAYQEIWNCTVDGVRCVSTTQMNEQKKDANYFYEGRGLLGGNRSSVEVLKTYPTLDALNRFTMTDMQFQVSSDNGSTWSDLTVDNVDLPGVIGCFKRSVSFSSGTYEIRCRCFNGALIGAWSNTVSITI